MRLDVIFVWTIILSLILTGMMIETENVGFALFNLLAIAVAILINGAMTLDKGEF